MRNHRIFIALWLFLAFIFSSVSSVGAFPPLPSSFYGSVQQDGENVPNGTLVEALIDGKVVAYSLSETYQGTSVFSLDVPGDDISTDIVEGGTPGEVIDFRVGGVFADQTAQWTSGVNENLDLTFPTNNVSAPEMPTFTTVSSQTAIPKTSITPTVAQTAASNSGYKEPIIEINISSTPFPFATHIENQANQEIQSEYDLKVTDEIGNSMQSSDNMDFITDPSYGEWEATSDQMAFIMASYPDGSVKNNTVLWIALSLLLLICVFAYFFVIHRKNENESNSSLL